MKNSNNYLSLFFNALPYS